MLLNKAIRAHHSNEFRGERSCTGNCPLFGLTGSLCGHAGSAYRSGSVPDPAESLAWPLLPVNPAEISCNPVSPLALKQCEAQKSFRAHLDMRHYGV